MIKRTLYFGNSAYLHLQDKQLVIRTPEKNTPDDVKGTITASIPVEDIGIVILDHWQITVTQGLMDALLTENCAVITCDGTHHPTGLMLPLCGHTLQSERFQSQLNASEPLRKQLWAQTIVQKIRNQAEVLLHQGLDRQYLLNLSNKVKSDDSGNAEATASAYYWSHIFPDLPGFRRLREGFPPNNLLNYGYAILRATMARSIVGAGLLPTLGIHHHNRYNAFCLADDLMEPYRPIVDLLVCKIVKTIGSPAFLEKEIKIELLKIPTLDVSIGGSISPLMVATQRTAVSLVRCYDGDSRKLLFPELS